MKRLPMPDRVPFARHVVGSVLARTVRLASRMLVAREDRRRTHPDARRLERARA